MSFKSLVKKLMKEGKSKEAATKIAGSVANAKMKGAGSGPTAKQKARSKTPTKMKKQGYNARLDDSLGAKNGKKKQSMKSRRDESEGMEESKGNKKFSGNKSSVQMKKSPTKKSKQKVEQDYARNAIADYKAGDKKAANYEKKKALEVAAGESPAKMKMSKAKKSVRKGKMTPDEAGAKGLGYGKNYDKLVKSRAYKKQRADEAGYKSVRKAKKAAKANDGFLPEGPAKMKKSTSMMKNPMMMKSNQNGGGYAAKNMAAPARQLKKLGSVLSKHMKSN
tara:strand:+ start:1660 stop:2493 length:834 start_codon:yes stop_codon:yes gene_type:complete